MIAMIPPPIRSLAVTAVVASFFVSLAHAQGPDAYPSRPVRMVVPYTPGGPIDVWGRILTQKLSEALGRQVVLDNKPGANGIVGTDIVAKSVPDGYTMLYQTGSHVANVSMYRKLPYDSVRDFQPITQMASTYGMVLAVHPTVPAGTLGEFIELARSRPGKLNFASAGSGNATHLAAELMKSAAGIDVVHVPYKGGGPALNDVMAGQIEMMMVSVAQGAPFVKAGRVRALAVTGPTRAPPLANVPTFQESGFPGFSFAGWHGLWFPAGVPRERLARMHGEVARIMFAPEMKGRLDELGLVPVASTPQEFAAFIDREIALYAKIVKAAKIEPQ
ncbi:MAG: tripartite tricarboxylate transporter substrate binding protein [Burkholderiales bacterium]|nr:tripartite tricarboxylate transporter substrate binding protein [Burkholderiales bacterium]